MFHILLINNVSTLCLIQNLNFNQKGNIYLENNLQPNAHKNDKFNNKFENAKFRILHASIYENV